MATRPVTNIEAFWQNDKPSGYSVKLHSVAGHEADWEEAVAGIIKSIQNYKEERRDPATVLAQLAAIAAKKPNISEDDTLLFVVGVAYLIDVRALKDDEYNGLFIVYGSNRAE